MRKINQMKPIRPVSWKYVYIYITVWNNGMLLQFEALNKKKQNVCSYAKAMFKQKKNVQFEIVYMALLNIYY